MKKRYIVILLLAQSMMLCAQQVRVGAKRALVSSSQVSAATSLAPSASAVKPRVLAATERALGHTDGDSITTNGAYLGEAGTYRVGAVLSSDKLSDYKGCKVVGLRFALSQSIGKTSAYIYNVVDGYANSLVETTVRRTSDGWNEVRFNSSQEYTIQGDDQLIFGFDYNESDAMVAAKNGALCFYTPKTEDPNASLLLQDDAFYPMTGVGNLCVQLIVDVSNLPKKDVRLTHLLAGNKYKTLGEDIDAYVQFSNTGLDDLASMRFGYRFDNGAVTYIDSNSALKSGEVGSVNKLLAMPSGMKPGSHKLTFYVDKIDGGIPTVTAGDTLTNSFVVYTKSLKRQQTYVEQYCSQKNYLGTLVNDQMNAVALDDSICLVNVYKDGETLSASGSAYLDELYAYTYPCFTIDRFYFMGENSIAFDVNDYASMMPTLVGDAVRMLVKEARLNPALATVDIRPSYSADSREITLDVSGELTDEAKTIYGDLGLTVMLTEDNVKSPQVELNAAGDATQTNRNYVHNHVLRAYLTEPTGDKMDIADGKYTARLTYTLPSAWVADNITAVAVVGKYLPEVDDNNVFDADITNAASVKVTAGGTGIGNVKVEPSAADGVYTLNGMRVGGSVKAKGIYIVRTDGVARKVVVK